MQKWLVVVPISEGSFCKEILEHVIEIVNFSVTRGIIEYASSAWDTNNKNVIENVEEKQWDLFWMIVIEIVCQKW